LNKRRQRNYVCSFCGKKFAKRSGKASHKRIHYKDPKNFKVARSEIDKDGLFAIIAIPRNTLTLEFFGERITPDEADVAEAKYLKEEINSRLFTVDKGLVIDGTKELNCMVKFVNHVCGPICEDRCRPNCGDMCGPNCEAVVIEIDGQKRIFIYTLRDIAEGKPHIFGPKEDILKLIGEELTIDYMMKREKGKNRMRCNCPSKKCRTFLN
jgi:[histone H3]-lysine4 N-trimethyltransferase SETD1